MIENEQDPSRIDSQQQCLLLRGKIADCADGNKDGNVAYPTSAG